MVKKIWYVFYASQCSVAVLQTCVNVMASGADLGYALDTIKHGQC